MLKSLFIKNYALIDELTLEFDNGLNIVTGETGAGKSIMVDAFLTALGERASTNLIRNNEKKAIIEAIFDANELLFDDLPEINELTKDQDELILRREINLTGNSRSFINDTPVQLILLKQLGDRLVDFHGQHQHQLLLNSSYHLSALDASINFGDKLEQYKSKYLQYKKLLKDYAELSERAKESRIKVDHYQFELDEIEKIDPKENELYELENKLKILENSEKIFSISNELSYLLSESESSVLTQLNHSQKLIEQLKDFDTAFADFYDECKSAIISINEIARYTNNYKASIDFDEMSIDSLKQRYFELNGLKKKYSGFDEVFERISFLRNELDSFNNYDEKIATLKKEISARRTELIAIGTEISKIRRVAANSFSNSLVEKLQYLGMENAKFEIEFKADLNSGSNEIGSNQIASNEIELYENGLDKIDFLISTNKGERLKQLKEVASGGEISRIMLAIKYIISESKQMPMLVFDEIDSGISGKIGQKTGLLMKELAQNHQILAITHLPQIAALGDRNFYVSKETKGDITNTGIAVLGHDEKVKMIAQMLSGENISDSAIENAEQLINYR